MEVNQQTGTSSGASTCASLSVRFVFIPPLKKMRWSVSQPSKGFLHKTFSALVCFFVHESVRSLYVRVVRFLRDYGTCLHYFGKKKPVRFKPFILAHKINYSMNCLLQDCFVLSYLVELLFFNQGKCAKIRMDDSRR